MTRQEQTAMRRPALDPYVDLVAAILSQAVLDARASRKGRVRLDDGTTSAEAVAFLYDPAAVEFFCALVGCDSVQPALLQAAGLSSLTG